MSIPKELPTWTQRDMYDAGIYSIHRERLWLCNYSVSVLPQMFSWIVVNIYPASSESDYRFEDDFMDRAILVTVDWDTSGKGCDNSSCYPTFPEKRTCPETSGPVIFPSGDFTSVTACQPACFAKRRTKQLLQSMNLDEKMYDSNDCPTCKYLSESAAYRTHRWLFGSNRIEEFDARDEKLKRIRRINDFPEVRYDEKETLKRDADMLNLKWDPKYNNCIIVDEATYRSVVEPVYRNPTPKCKVTNFELGEDIIWGLRFHERDERFEPNYNFTVGRSSAYCRAFNKERDPVAKDCYVPWWQKALSYTIAGAGLIQAAHSLVHYEKNCLDQWRTDSGDRNQVKVEFNGQTNYYKWQRDINVNFVLPPPNVKLSDLGIDVKVTGNRLYWNNVEGIISQFAMFRSVDELVSDESSLDRFVPNENPLYRYSYSTLYKSYDDDDDNNNNNDGDNFDEDATSETSDDKKLLSNYRDLMMQKIDNMQKRKMLGRNIRDDLSDPDLDRTISELWPDVKKTYERLNEQRATAAATTNKWKSRARRFPLSTNSVQYNIYPHEYISQKLLSLTVNTDNPTSALLPNMPDSQLDPKKVIEELKEARRQAKDDRNSDLDELMADLQENLVQKNILLELFKDMGISLTFDFAITPIIENVLKRLYLNTLKMISLYTDQVVSKTLLRAGLRLAASRTIGTAVSALTVRSMILVGEVASVVGIVLVVTGLVSLVFDIAMFAGWDPGQFNNEIDLTVYYDMAKYFADTMNVMRRGEVDPLELMKATYMKVATEQQDFDSVRETLVANQQRKKRSIDDDDSGGGGDDVPSVIPLDEPHEKPIFSDIKEKSLHVNERLTQPQWFNKSFTACFEKNYKTRTIIANSVSFWNVVNSLDYLGSMQTNSFGQRIVPYPQKIRMLDEDITSLITEANYRKLLTTTSNTSIDNAEYNRRIRATEHGSRIFLSIGLGIAAIWIAMTSYSTFSVWSNRDQKNFVLPFPLVAFLLICVTLLCFVFSFVAMVPLKLDENDDNANDENQSDDSWKLSKYVRRLHEIVG